VVYDWVLFVIKFNPYLGMNKGKKKGGSQQPIVVVENPLEAVAEMAKPKEKKEKKVVKITTSLDWVRNIIRPFTKVVTHFKPHADEVLAFLMFLEESGREIYPNLFKDGEFRYEDIEWRRDNVKFEETQSRPEALFLGLGESPYDEHAIKGRHNEAACTLVAAEIGIFECPWWIKSIEDVRREDREGGAQQGEIPHILKMLYRNAEEDRKAIENTIRFGLMSYHAETEFLKGQWEKFCELYKNTDRRWRAWYDYLNELGGPLTTAKVKEYLQEIGISKKEIEWYAEMVRVAHNYEVQSKVDARRILEKEGVFYPFDFNGETVYICSIETDNQETPKVCWKYHGRQVALLVSRSKRTKHTSVLSNHKFNIDLTVAGEKLQRNERQGAEWYIDRNGRFLLNGNAERFSDVKPTQKSLQDIVRLLQTQLDDDGQARMGKRFSELPSLA
jgi:hypothetical protein